MMMSINMAACSFSMLSITSEMLLKGNRVVMMINAYDDMIPVEKKVGYHQSASNGRVNKNIFVSIFCL